MPIIHPRQILAGEVVRDFLQKTASRPYVTEFISEQDPNRAFRELEQWERRLHMRGVPGKDVFHNLSGFEIVQDEPMTLKEAELYLKSFDDFMQAHATAIPISDRKELGITDGWLFAAYENEDDDDDHLRGIDGYDRDDDDYL